MKLAPKKCSASVLALRVPSTGSESAKHLHISESTKEWGSQICRRASMPPTSLGDVFEGTQVLLPSKDFLINPHLAQLTLRCPLCRLICACWATQMALCSLVCANDSAQMTLCKWLCASWPAKGSVQVVLPKWLCAT